MPGYKNRRSARRSAWNRVYRRATARLKAEYPERYAEIVTEETAREGLLKKRSRWDTDPAWDTTEGSTNDAEIHDGSR